MMKNYTGFNTSTGIGAFTNQGISQRPNSRGTSPFRSMQLSPLTFIATAR